MKKEGSKSKKKSVKIPHQGLDETPLPPCQCGKIQIMFLSCLFCILMLPTNWDDRASHQ